MREPVYSTALHVGFTVFCILTWMSSRLENLAIYGGSIVAGAIICTIAGSGVAYVARPKTMGFIKISAALVCLCLSFEAVPDWLQELEQDSRY